MGFLDAAKSVVNIGSSLLNGIQAKKQYAQAEKMQEKSIQAQKDENTRNMNFNASQSAAQRNWQEKMYEKQREDTYAYNDPSAVMSRLKSAGLNPALYYDGAGTGIVQASVGSGSSASSSATGIGDYDMTNRAMQNLSQNMLQAQMQMAQISNINENTKATRIDNDYKPFYKTKELSLLDGQINLTLAKEITEKGTATQIATLNEKAKKEIEILGEDLINKRGYNSVYNSPEGLTALHDLLQSEADMKVEERNQYAEFFRAKIAQMSGSARSSNASALNLENEIMAKLKAKVRGQNGYDLQALSDAESAAWVISSYSDLNDADAGLVVKGLGYLLKVITALK